MTANWSSTLRTPLTPRTVFSTLCLSSADLTDPASVTLPFSTSVLTSSFARTGSASIALSISASIDADPVLAKLDVSTLVENGKVTLAGSVRSAELRQRVEKTVRGVKGVLSVDDQLVVIQPTP